MTSWSRHIAEEFGSLDEQAAAEAFQRNCGQVLILTGEMWIAMHILNKGGSGWDAAAQLVRGFVRADHEPIPMAEKIVRLRQGMDRPYQAWRSTER